MNALVEREAVMAALLAAVGGGRVALVAGEAGIGKTSVLRALAEAHATSASRPGPVWWGACDALETPHPLAPLLDIARGVAPTHRAAFRRWKRGPRTGRRCRHQAVQRGLLGAVALVVDPGAIRRHAARSSLEYVGFTKFVTYHA